MRVIDRVTRISAPSLVPAGAPGSPALRPTRPRGSRGSSRSGRTCPPGRRVPRARSRSSGVPRTRRTRRLRGPAGPAPTITVSYSAAAARSGSRGARPPAAAAVADGLAVHDANGGEVALGRQRARPLLRIGRHVRLEPSEPDLVAVEESSQLRARSVAAMAEDDRPEGGRCGRAGLEASGPTEPVVREETYALRNLGRGGCELLVVVQVDPEHTRRLRCAEAAGVEHPERDRHLAEDVTRLPLTDDALHPSTRLTTSIRPSRRPKSARSSPRSRRTRLARA